MPIHSRGPLLYTKPGDAFDQMPLVLQQLVGDRGIAGYLNYFNHFETWNGPLAEGTLGGWVLSGATGVATVALTLDEVNTGIIALTTETAVANANAQLQLTSMPISYKVGKRLWCFAKLKLSDVDDELAMFGLMGVDTDVFSTLPTQGIFFEKDETVTDWDFHVRDGGASTEDTTFSGLTLADDTYHVLGFSVDVVGNVTPYFGTTSSGLKAYTTVARSNTQLGTLNTGADIMVPTFAVQTGASQADNMEVDWLLVCREL